MTQRARTSFPIRRVLVGLALAGGVGAFVWSKTRPALVVATPVTRGEAVEAVYATGTVEAENRARVLAKTSGTLKELRVREGQRVKAGDLIAVIDSPALEIELRRGKGDLSAARAQAGRDAPQIEALRSQGKALEADLELARRDLDRLKRVASGVVTQSEIERAESRVKQLEASLRGNSAQQRSLRIDLDATARRRKAEVDGIESRAADTELRAPIDGVVLSRAVEVGELVVQNQPLFSVGETSSLVLEVQVDEADVARISDGTHGKAASKAAVSLYAFSGRVFEASVYDIQPDANRARKSFLTRLRFVSPPPELRSGMSAELNIVVARRANVLLAPTAAEESGLMWLVREGRAQRVPVKTGLRDLLRVEITEGVTAGDLAIIEGRDKLREGARVSVTERVLDKAAALPDGTQSATAGR